MKEKLPFKPTTTPVIALAVAAGLASLLATFLLFSRSQSPQPAPLTSPRKGETREVPPGKTAAEAVSALGRLEPQGEVIKVAPPPNLGGAKLKKLLVEEGDQVREGQAIAVLDSYDLKQKAVQLAAEDVRVAEANLNIVKAGAKKGEIQAQQAELERLKAELVGTNATNRAKIARLEAELAGEKQTQMATIERLGAELDNARREFQRYQKLASNGAISDSDLDARRLAWKTSQEKLQEARANLNKTVATLSEQLTETRADSQKTAATLEKQIREAAANLDRVAEVRGVDVQKGQVEVERAFASLQQAKEELDLTLVKAPFKGQVLKIKTYPGENVDQKEGIVELGRTDRMLAVAEVYESDISKVRLGQKATVKSENASFPGELHGTVQQIGLQIGKKDVLENDPAADIDVRVVEVKILLDSESSREVPGFTNAKVIVKILP